MRNISFIGALALAIAGAISSPAYALLNNEHNTTNNYYDQSTTNAPSANATGIGIGSAEATAVGIGGTGIGFGGSATIQQGAVDIDNIIASVNKQAQDQAQRQDQKAFATGGDASNNGVSQKVVFKAAKQLPGMITADSQGPRNPEIQTNDIIAAKMLESAEAEIKATTGKALLKSFRHTENGCTAAVSYSETECSVRAYPSGSSLGITPSMLEAAAYHAAAKIGMALKPATYYISAENKSKGFGAGVSNSGSLANADRGLVGGVAAALSGNSGSTRQTPYIIMVYTGAK